MMSGHHLSKEMIDRMVVGEISEEERADVLSHLDSGCQECERFLEDMNSEQEEWLLSLLICSKTATDKGLTLSDEDKKIIFDSVCSELSVRSLPKSETGYGRIKIMALAAGLILTVGLSIFFARNIAPTKGPNIKGGKPINVRNIFLQFSVLKYLSHDEGSPQVIPGVNRAVYPQDGHMIFRYEVEMDSNVYIVRIGPDTNTEQIYPALGDPDQMRRAGTHDVNQGDQYLVYSLKGLTGLQTFCAVATNPESDNRDEAVFKAKDITERNKNMMASRRLRKKGIDCFQIKVGQP
jgi:hypothetical protein